MRPSATMIYIAVFVTFLNGNTISAAEILTSQEIITLIEGNSMCLTGERFLSPITVQLIGDLKTIAKPKASRAALLARA